MKTVIQVLLCILMPLGAWAQQQNPDDMQNQMNSADQPQSAGTTTLYKTPLKTYQIYYAAFTGGHSKNSADCYTSAFRQKEFDGATPADQDYLNIDSKIAQLGNSNFQLLSFVFTPDSKKPKITFLYSSSRGQVTMKEQMVLTMVDTAFGWKIDAIENVEK